jgi:hypothetical protein
MNLRYDLHGTLSIKPNFIFSRNRKSFIVLIGNKNNPKSEIIK